MVKPEREADHDAGRRVVLYIEDNDVNTVLMEMILKQFKHIEMVAALTAEDGLEIASELRPVLVLMDIHLPGMSGIEATTRLRRMEGLEDVPVIAVSADTTPETMARAKQAGCVAYVTKPFDIGQVAALITAHLGDGTKGGQ